MRKYRSYSIKPFVESLELRLSLSAIHSFVAAPTLVVSAVVSQQIDDDPPPDPEPDPGDLPTDDPPIVYPPIPPSGPVGPGLHLSS